jgi:putative colanic acid biosynthesis acetyltransferase WcaF
MLLTGNHNYKSVQFEAVTGSFTSEECVFIGAKSIVCSGVIYKSHNFLAAIVSQINNFQLTTVSITQ